MTVEIMYYIFSLTTLLLAIIHMCNMAYYKSHGKTLIGLTFKKGTVEYARMRKAASKPYEWLSFAAIPLLSINLYLAIQDMFKVYNRKTAILLLVIYTLFVLVIFIWVIVKLRDYLGDMTKKPNNKKRNISNDDEW